VLVLNGITLRAVVSWIGLRSGGSSLSAVTGIASMPESHNTSSICCCVGFVIIAVRAHFINEREYQNFVRIHVKDRLLLALMILLPMRGPPPKKKIALILTCPNFSKLSWYIWQYYNEHNIIKHRCIKMYSPSKLDESLTKRFHYDDWLRLDFVSTCCLWYCFDIALILLTSANIATCIGLIPGPLIYILPNTLVRGTARRLGFSSRFLHYALWSSRTTLFVPEGAFPRYIHL